VQIANVFRQRLTAVAFFLGLLLGIRDAGSPSPLGIDAPADIASAGRATVHVARIAEHPHTVGTPPNDEARRYIETQLHALGFSVRRITGVVGGASVSNVLARLEGTQRGLPGVVLSAHYDSAREGAGARSDAFGCGAILEAARALTTRGPLQHPLVIAITDGEERGQLGAKLLMDRGEPWIVGAKFIFNFNGVRTDGPLWMLETKGHEGTLLSLAQRSGAHVTGNSLAAALYGPLHGDADLSVFRAADLPGLSFRGIRSADPYGAATAPRDSLRALQQATSLAKGLVLANETDVGVPRGEGFVWFTVFGRVLMYPAWLASVVALLGLLLHLKAMYGQGVADAAVPSVGSAVLTLLHLATALLFPQASFLFALPALAVSVSLHLSTRGHALEPIARCVAIATCGLLWIPICFVLEDASGTLALCVAIPLAALWLSLLRPPRGGHTDDSAVKGTYSPRVASS
jgi:hypothetical protein